MRRRWTGDGDDRRASVLITENNPLARYGWSAQVELGIGDDETPGRVTRVDRDGALVVTGTGTSRARVPEGVSVAVGDWVGVGVEEGERAVIRSVGPRRGQIVRKDPGEDQAQVLASNVDVGLIVQALDRPYVPERIERYLILVEGAGARPVIVLTKADLADGAAVTAQIPVDLGDMPVVEVGHHSDEGLELLRQTWAPVETIALLGESGAGKSTLANRLLGDEVLATAATRAGDSKGRHTTVTRELIPLPGGGVIIDTPGLRAVGMWTSWEELDEVFSDIASLAEECRFNDCSHVHEPGCAVRIAAEEGTLTDRRYQSYLKLRDEMIELEERLERTRRRRSRRT